MWQYQNTDELYHYGIIGMKWGVRRYQNKDGSLTSAGKKRRKKQMSADAEEVYKLKKKRVYEMSNEEIRKVNNRSKLESELRRNNAKSFGRVAAGTAAVGTSLVMLGRIGSTIDSINKLKNFGKPIVKRIIKGK